MIRKILALGAVLVGGFFVPASSQTYPGIVTQGSFWTDITDADGAANAHIQSFRDRLFVDDGVLCSGAWNAGNCVSSSRGGTAINSVGWNWAPTSSSIYTLNSWGDIGVTGQSVSSSSNRSGNPSGPTSSSTAIGVAGFGLNDLTSTPFGAWGGYFEALRKTASTGGALAVEADVGNVGAVIDIDPYSFPTATTGATAAFWGGCGGSAGAHVTYTNCTTAIGILPNTAKFRKGITVSGTALDTSVGNSGGGIFLDLPTQAEFRWSNGAAVPVSEMWGGTAGITINQSSGTGSPHLGMLGQAPTISACTGFSAATNSTDYAGKATFTSATTCVLNFAKTYGNAPFCSATPGSAVSTAQVTTSTTQLSITFGAAQTAFSWHCDGV